MIDKEWQKIARRISSKRKIQFKNRPARSRF